jgi:HEAT repeat protein
VTDESHLVRAAAIAAQLRFGERGVPNLRLAVRSRSLDAALLALKALGDLGLPTADRELRRVARGARKPAQIRLQAARQLIRRGIPGGPQTLCELLSRGKKGIRLQAARSLGDDLSARGDRCLREALKTKDEQVQHAAWGALARRKAAVGQ